MAIRARLRAATLGFYLVFALSGFSRSSAEPIHPVDFDGIVPESAAVFSRDVEPSRIPEETPSHPDPEVRDDVDANGDVDVDAWAEAFASGSRIAYRPRLAEAPVYHVEMTPQVQRFLDLFTGKRRELVTVWVSRSGRYLGMIREVLRSRGLPEELAFTAMIESGFKPDAVSRMGAKGMWQFMAGTARRYGLRVDSWVDERYDPEKSTVAAAGYLRDLYAQFGSWSLAQAAYNAGEMKVARAIRKTGSSDFWTLAESKYLRQETEDFVPQIQAVTLIGRDPDNYGFEFDEVEPVAIDTVRVPPGTHLRRLASMSGVPFETLRSLNRVLVRGITPPGKPWELRVPAGSRDPILTALAPRRPTPEPLLAGASKKPRVVAASTQSVRPAGPDIHIVRPRDTVTSIARRYGVSVSDVLRWNRLEQQARIRPGDRLRVAIRPSVEPDGQGGFR